MKPSAAAAASVERRSSVTLKAIGTYFLGLAATKLISIAMLPVYTRLFNPSQYGVWELIDFSVQLLALLFGMQLPVATVYQLSLAKNKAEILSTAVIGAGILGMVICCSVVVASRPISILVFGMPHYTTELRVGASALLFSFPGGVALAYIRLTDRGRLYVAILFARLGTQIGFTLFFVMSLHKGILGALYGALIASFLSGTAAVISSVPCRHLSFSWHVFRKQIQYGGFLALSEALAYIVNYGDRPLLARSVPLSEVGLYTLAYKGGMLVVYMQKAINLHWNTQIFSIATERDSVLRIRRARTRIMLVLIGMAVVLALFSHLAMALLLSRNFERGSSLVPFVLGAYVLRGVAEQLRSQFLVLGATRTDFVVNAISTSICVVCYLWLIPTLGVWGAIIATILSFAAMTLIAYLLLGKERRLVIDMGRIGKAAGIGSVVVGVFCWMRPGNLWAEGALAICSSACFLVIMLLVTCDGEDRREILSLLHTVPALRAVTKPLRPGVADRASGGGG